MNAKKALENAKNVAKTNMPKYMAEVHILIKKWSDKGQTKFDLLNPEWMALYSGEFYEAKKALENDGFKVDVLDCDSINRHCFRISWSHRS